MDLLSVLPPELVLAIALHLDLDTIACCLLACRQWYDLLSCLEPYWRHACVQLGLSENLIKELIVKYESTKRVAFVAGRHRQVLTESPHFSMSVTEGYPYNIHYVCNSAKGNTLVGTVYKDFKPCGIVIKTIERTSVNRTVIDPRFPMLAENRTYWARIVSDTLVHVTASGLWSIYDLTHNGALLAQWRGGAIFDSEVKIGICEMCRTVCTAKLVCSHTQPAYWNLRIMSPNMSVKGDGPQKKPRTVRFRLDTEVQCGEVKHAMKSALLFPQTTQTNSRGACARHSLLLQCGSTVYSYKLLEGDTDLSQSKLMLTYTPESNCSADPNIDASLSKISGLSTELVLSTDQELLGMVFNSQLLVWERKTRQLLSVAYLELDTYIHEQIRLIALGRVYSLIGLEFSSSLLIVLTNTGHIVREVTDFARRHISLVPPYIEFLGAIQDQWLSNFSHVPNASLPTVIYWNKTNRTVEGISFGKDSGENLSDQIVPTRRRAWWKIW